MQSKNKSSIVRSSPGSGNGRTSTSTNAIAIACESDDEYSSTDWFICRMCNKNFPGKSQLWQHKRAVHSRSVQSPHSQSHTPSKSNSSFQHQTKSGPAPNKNKNKTTITFTTTTTTTSTTATSTFEVINIDDKEEVEQFSHTTEKIGQENSGSNSGLQEQNSKISKVSTTGANSSGYISDDSPSLRINDSHNASYTHTQTQSSHSPGSRDEEEGKVTSNSVSVIQWSKSYIQKQRRERNQQRQSKSPGENSEAKRRKIELICLSSDSEDEKENENEQELEEILDRVSCTSENQSQSSCQSPREEKESSLPDSPELEEQEETVRLPVGTVAVSPIPEQLPKVYAPLIWLSETKPLKFPYFPQIGDDLVYFRQGHELYIDHMQKIESNPAKFYLIDKKMKKLLPYVQHPNLPAEISVRVVDIKFELLPPRLVRLKLARTDWNTGAISEDYITVKYHDVDSVVDFLVLRQIYDRSLTRQHWKVGQKFRSIVEKKWWLGKILDISPFSNKFPNSNFLRYFVEWEAESEEESLSPWDIEEIPDDFESAANGVPASEKELSSNFYRVQKGDWEPSGNQNEECDRISKLIQDLIAKDFPQVAPFVSPVDIEKFPDYLKAVPYPIDLSMIITRLNNRFYRRIDAVETDVDQLVNNTSLFNGPDAEIVQWAENLREYLFSHFKKSKLRQVQRRLWSF